MITDQETGHEIKLRPCLRCGKLFPTDRWHRICRRCHKSIERARIGPSCRPLKVCSQSSEN